MKIVRLTAENVKKLRAVEITPSGEIVTISGKNGAGKTSVLDSIWWALAGTKNIQGQPIRKGETKARIKLDLGELVVERKFTAAGSTLSVDSADGARFSSPQKMLDALLGELSFDPLAFARMDPRKQFDELRRVSKLEVDIDHLDALNKADYDRRTEINRDARAKRAQAEGISVPPDSGAEPEDEAALVDSLQKAGETNSNAELDRERRAASARTVERNRASATDARERAATLRKQADQLDADAVALEQQADGIERGLAKAPALAELIDVGAIRRKIDEARATNASIARRKESASRKQALLEEAKSLERQAADITFRMEAREKTKSDAIKAAAMPVPGVGFGDGIVTYNGIPFDQASSAEQLRVSMSIAMAANPKLRVIRITDGSLLDEDSLAAIGQMAKADDFQVWIERVDASGKLGIVIDDGAVVADKSRAPAEAAAE